MAGESGNFDSINDVLAAVHALGDILVLNASSMRAAKDKVSEMQSLLGRLIQVRSDLVHIIGERDKDSEKVEREIGRINEGERDGNLTAASALVIVVRQYIDEMRAMCETQAAAVTTERERLERMNTRVEEIISCQADALGMLRDWPA